MLAHGGAPDLLVHCAGGSHVGFSLAHPLQDFERNVDTTAAALEFLRRRAPHARLLFISSAAVYGEAAGGPLSEDAPAAPVSPYGAHKRMAEELCRSYARSFGLRTSVLRLFSVYGAGLRKQLLWDACTRLAAGAREFSGTGGELRDWLHVGDAAALIRVLADAAEAPAAVLNGGTGTGLRVADVLAELAAALGAPPATFNGSRRPGDPTSLVADIARARRLGWAPRHDWRRGMREYAEWFRSLG